MDSKLANDIAEEMGGEVLRSRIEGNEIVVLLVDGRKVRRTLPAETEPFKYIEEAVKEQTQPPLAIPNQWVDVTKKKGKGK